MPFLVVLSGEQQVLNRKYNKFCTEECLDKIKYGKLQCKCGEDYSIIDWQWENDMSTNLKLSNNNREVLFHPTYSSGTAAVRGTTQFEKNMHHYWEVKMMSKLYGTDVMVGVATAKLDYESCKLNFCSMLGIDGNSYGYSYMGVIQHNKLRQRYGFKYGLGSIIGVHLDMCSGTMEYFLNRKPLGIAFRGLKNEDLYPMVSSTAAQSAVRITCSMSQEPTLQMLCLKTVMNNDKLHEHYRTITGLTRIYDREYFWMRPYKEEQNEMQRLADLEEDVMQSLTRSRKTKKPRSSWVPLLHSDDLEDSSSSSSSDDNMVLRFRKKMLRLQDIDSSLSESDLLLNVLHENDEQNTSDDSQNIDGFEGQEESASSSAKDDTQPFFEEDAKTKEE